MTACTAALNAAHLSYLRGIGALIRLSSSSDDYAVTTKQRLLDDVVVVAGHVAALLHSRRTLVLFDAVPSTYHLQKRSIEDELIKSIINRTSLNGK